MKTRQRRWLNSTKGPLILLLMVICFNWKLVLISQYDWIRDFDLTQQVLPWFEEQSRQVHQRQFPLWDPHTWAGQPLIGQAQPGTVYPLNWILFALPRRDGHISMSWLQWYYVAIQYMAALFSYLLCRDLGRSRIASLIAASIFGLGGYVATVGWPQMANGAVWAPLILLFLLRAARNVHPAGSAALSGLFLGLAWLSGHHQVPTYLTLAACGVWLFLILRKGVPNWRTAGLAALAMSIAALTGAAQILPATEYGRLAVRWAGASEALSWNQPVPYQVHGQYSLSPIALLGIIFPGLGGYSDPFIGFAAFSLMLIAVAACWHRQEVRIFAALALAGALYSLGRSDIFQGVIYAVVPLVEKARAPSMAIVVFNCAAAALAAFAVDWLPGEQLSPWPRRAAIGSAILGTAVLTLILGTMLANKLSWGLDDRIGMTALAALLFAALLCAWRSGSITRTQAVTLALLLVLLELGNGGGPWGLAARSDAGHRAAMDKTTSNKDIAAFLSAQPKPFRIESEGDNLSVNWGEYHDFDFLRAMTPSATSNLMRLEFHTRQTKRLFNVRYTLARTAPDPGSREVFTAASGLKVYEDPAAFPRAWTVHELIRVANAQQGRYYVANRLDDLRGKAFLTGESPRLDSCAEADRVDFIEHRPRQVTMNVAMGCTGMLVLSDTLFPGWRATVDGRGVGIHEVNFAMRGVVVPAGSHQVRFKYTPRTVYAGAALTLLGLGAALGIAALDRRAPVMKDYPQAEVLPA
jgi:hypothetical protein